MHGVRSRRDTLPVKEHILFICTANRDRSRTAEDLYQGDPRYQVLSAGVAPFATVPLTRELLLWANRIFVMNESADRHHTAIKMRFPGIDRDIVDLDVADRWPRGDAELVALLEKRLEPHLGAPQKDDDAG